MRMSGPRPVIADVKTPVKREGEAGWEGKSIGGGIPERKLENVWGRKGPNSKVRQERLPFSVSPREDTEPK